MRRKLTRKPKPRKLLCPAHIPKAVFERAAELASASRPPSRIEAHQLWTLISQTTADLALLARAQSGSSVDAARLLGSLPRMSTRVAIKVLGSAPASGSCTLAESLSAALIDANEMFYQAVRLRPRQFTKVARKNLHWPSLYRTRVFKDDNRDEDFRQLVQAIELGYDFGLKSSGNIDFESFANVAAAKLLHEIISHRTWALESPSTAHPPFVKQVAKLPPLVKKREVLSCWWRVGLELLKRDKDELVGLREFENYRRQGQRAWERNSKADKDSKAIKPETKAWNLFTTDCKKAFERLARLVTDETKKSP